MRSRSRRPTSAHPLSLLVALLIVTGLTALPTEAQAEQNVDPFYGSYQEQVPISVPPFRGIEPKLGLSYNSTGGNGFVGLGWNLDGVSTIERASPGKGAPKYNGADIFLLDGQELVPSGAMGGTHCTKIQSYLKIVFNATANTWTIWQKDGTKSVYGALYDVGYGTFRWALVSVSDTKNNTVGYSWWCDPGADCYLSSITYGGVSVTFFAEPRPDPISFATGGHVGRMNYRLRSVFVWMPGVSHIRAYQLNYTTAAATSRSVLASVRQYGRDVTHDGAGLITGGTALPAITLGYQGEGWGFGSGSQAGLHGVGNAGAWFADMNGDGKEDYITKNNDTCIHWNLSSGSGFAGGGSQCGLHGAGNAGRWVVDINGDGKADYVTKNNDTTIHWNLSNGSGWNGPQSQSGLHGVGNLGTWLIDINADGKTDYVTKNNDGCIHWNLSTGYGWAASQTQCGLHGAGSAGRWFVDINGDRLPDYVAKNNDGTIHWNLGTGTGWAANQAQSGLHGVGGVGMWFVDINGDGKSDYVTKNNDYCIHWNLSNGNGWGPNQTQCGVHGTGTTRFLVDINGDGMTDYVAKNSDGCTHWNLSTGTGWAAPQSQCGLHGVGNAGTWFADISGDGRPDYVTKNIDYTIHWDKTNYASQLMTSVANGAGGSTSIAYTPSSAWSNTNNPPVTQSVTSITAYDGRGGAATTRFSYQGGLWDAAESRFMGYRYAKTTDPCISGEAACPYIEVYFKQDYGSVSKPEYVYHRDGSGKVLTYRSHYYTTNGATVPYTSLESQGWEYVYDAAGAYSRSVVTRSFDGYGNVTVEYLYGDYDVSGDEKTVRYIYYPNTGTYVVSKHAAIDTFSGFGTGGALLTQGLFYYDGNTTWAAAPTAGKVTKTATWVNTSNSYVTKTVEYDSWGNVTAEMDDLGNRTSFTIDPAYKLYVTGVTNALGQTSTQGWDTVCGVRTSSTDPNGRVVSMQYDNLCRLTYTSLPGGGFESRSYVNLGNPYWQYVEVTTPAANATGNLWTRTYLDGLGRVWRTESKGPSAGKEIRNDVIFDARGNTWKATAPYYANEAAYWTTTSYDAHDRPVTLTYPDGATERRDYGLGLVTTTDQNGNLQVERMNGEGQIVEHRERSAGVWHTTYSTYDARGHLSQITDPAGNRWYITTDSLGRRVQVSDPDTGTWRYEYDAAGRQVAQIDSKGQRTEFTYDAIGRRQTKTVAAGTPSANTMTWQYDQGQIGKLTTMTDPSGVATYEYDAAGRLWRGTRTINGQSFTFSKGYDAGGRLKWTSYPDGDSVGTAASPLVYDGAGRLSGIPGIVSSASYNASGDLTQHTNANGTVTTKARSATRGWLTSINTVRGTATLQNLVYSRDGGGRITSITSPFAYEGWSYGYDDMNRLTWATNHGNAAFNQTFAYDAIGNMTSNSRVGGYAYAAAGQARPHAVTAAGTNQYAYDANGNMVTGNGRTITWDADNRPIAINSTTYSYDAEGARLSKTVAGVTTYYVGDDYEMTAGLVTKYVALAGAVVAKRVGAATSWIHTDHQGTVQVITDAAGNEVQRLKHRPYGERLETATSHEEARGYTGKRVEDSGLMYLHARYYDPVIGRFISPDPTIPSPRTVGLNRYAYSANDPVTFTDIDGLGFFKKLKKAFKKIGKAITKVVNAVSKVPVIGGLLRVAAITALGPIYGITTGDWKGLARAYATAAIMVAAVVLTALLPPAGAGLWAAVGYVAGSAAIGFASGAGIALVNGASMKDAMRAGLTGAAISGGLAALNAFYLAKVKMSPAEYTQKAGHTFGTNDGALNAAGDPAFFAEGSDAMIMAEKVIPGGKAISGMHDWFVGTLDYATGPVNGQQYAAGLQIAKGLKGIPIAGGMLEQVYNVGTMALGAAITWGAYAAPYSGLIVGSRTLAHDYRQSARSVSSTGWLGNATGQPFGLAAAH